MRFGGSGVIIGGKKPQTPEEMRQWMRENTRGLHGDIIWEEDILRERRRWRIAIGGVLALGVAFYLARFWGIF